MIGAILLFAQLQGSLQAGVAVHPDTVTVGEHFTAVARVRAPGHVTIRFPSAPDSGSAIDTAGASTQHDESTAHVSDVSITYVLAAWDTGTVRLQLGDAIIEDGNITRRAPLNSASIYVKSVLPKDTSLRKPKSARPPIEVRPFDWRPWIYAALALLAALLAFFLWRWWRRRRDRPIPPLTWAEREFRRVEALGLLEKGERERYAVLMADVMREYLARRRPSIQRSATTTQITTAIARDPMVPGDRIVRVLQQVDLVKFARRSVSADEAQTVGTESRAIVGDVERRLTEAANAPQASAQVKAA